MRKMKVLSILFFVISVAIFVAYGFYEKDTNDTTPPVLQCETDEITVSVTAGEEELLKGVVATDDVSGDISEAVVVESISSFTEENTRIITYAAIDAKGNVGRCQRTLVYEDYERATFSLSEPLRFPKGKVMDLLSRVGAHSSLDGDLTDKVKYTLDNTIDLSDVGVYPIEYRVMDGTGSIEYLPLELEIYDPANERINVVLSKYLVYVPLNAKFKPDRYYVGSDIEGELSVRSGVDTTKEGIYYVDYTVTGTNSIGKSRLVVVVSGS